MSLHNIAIKEGPKIEKKILHPRGWTDYPQNIPDSSLCHSQPIMNISWKSTHPFYRNVANRHAVVPGRETVKQSRKPLNSLDNYFLGHLWQFMKIPGKSVPPFFHNIINKHGSRKYKKQPWIRGLIATSQKCYKSLLLSCPKFAENFMKVRSSVIP